MPQSGGLHLDLTVAQTMSLYADIRRAPRDRCAALLDEAGLVEHTRRPVGELSGGMRQRLGFALALLTDPADPRPRRTERQPRRRQPRWLASTAARTWPPEGRTVLVSTHAGQELLTPDIGASCSRTAVSSRPMRFESARDADAARRTAA